MKKQVFAITTTTFNENGGVSGGGVVGIFSTKEKAREVLDAWKRKLVENCWATITYEDKNYFNYTYDNKTIYQNEIYWYELNDKTMTQYGHCPN